MQNSWHQTHTFPSALRLLNEPRHQRSGRLSLDGSSWRPPAHPHGPIKKNLWDSAEIRRVIYLTQGGNKINKHNKYITYLHLLWYTMIYIYIYRQVCLIYFLTGDFWATCSLQPLVPWNSGPLVALMSCYELSVRAEKSALPVCWYCSWQAIHICNLSLIAQVKSINGISSSWNSVSRLVSPKPSTNQLLYPRRQDHCRP